MVNKSLYQILGVSKSASDAEIKTAYRKLARTMHPDLNPNDPKAEEKFKEVSAAYDILSDKEKRSKYDRGEIDENGRERPGYGFGGFGGGNSGFGGGSSRSRRYSSNAGFDFSDIFGEDVFKNFSSGNSGFGGSSRSRGSAKGSNINYSLKVSFEDAVLGIEKTVSLANAKKINVKIPAGTIDGQTLRLKGQGNPGYGGGDNGDALIEIKVNPHQFFELDGKNVKFDLPITIKEAVEGAKITVPTLTGKINVTVPPQSNSGDTLRIKGKGVPEQGDLLIRLKIVLPDGKDDALEKFVKKWKPADTKDPRAKAGLV